MADLLWQKPGVAVDAQIQTFLAGDDVILDREFFLHDIAASAAHAQGLQHIGILSADELDGCCANWRCWRRTSAKAASCSIPSMRMATRRSKRA